MAVTYITRDGTKIDGTTGQDHLLRSYLWSCADQNVSLRPFFVSGAVSGYLWKFLSTRLSRGG